MTDLIKIINKNKTTKKAFPRTESCQKEKKYKMKKMSNYLIGISFTCTYELQRNRQFNKMSLVMRKPDFRICENKDADQLRGNREADQRLCFRDTDSTIPLVPKYEISSL